MIAKNRCFRDSKKRRDNYQRALQKWESPFVIKLLPGHSRLLSLFAARRRLGGGYRHAPFGAAAGPATLAWGQNRKTCKLNVVLELPSYNGNNTIIVKIRSVSVNVNLYSGDIKV